MRGPRFQSFFRQHQLPGTGTLPLQDFVHALALTGYAGPLTYELSPTVLEFWLPARALERLKRCVDFAHRAIG